MVSRRGFITLATGGVGALALTAATGVPAFAESTPTPKLPGEYFRKPNQLTAAGTLFDNICVRINGDVARIHVPQTVKPFSGQAVPVVWFYHGGSSDHNALDGGFKLVSAAVVDHGWVAICQTAGGNLYSHPTATALQVAGYQYMSQTFTVKTNVLRATSAGGALATETYASKLIPSIAGMYSVNGTYDIRAHYDSGGRARDSVIAAFGDDPGAIDAANPARHSAAAWAGSTMRIVVSQPSETDLTVPPDDHGLALLALASPVAAEATMRAHTNGHSTPGFALPDFIASMERWVGASSGGDRTPPSAAIVAPVNGAVLKGYATVTVNATDNVGVVDVGIYHGESRLLTLTKQSATQWGARIWTVGPRTPNGDYVVTARATDAAGNVGISSPIKVKIAN
ncbi:Ig-like domain-containing protein [Micromonospora sp. DT81.3]|uniref:Ig-like domain-containing protein n=1 Tax=Micromonospora sp. DT81.3 TaxID=3416523 RepID=UPI003CFB4388